MNWVTRVFLVTGTEYLFSVRSMLPARSFPFSPTNFSLDKCL